MKVLVWSIALWTLAFLLHLLLWRMRLPKRQTRALLAVFLGVLTGGMVFFALGPGLWPDCAVYLPTALPECLHVGLLFIAVTLAYIVTYSALEVDSPSLVMVMAIADAGANGLGKRQFEQSMTDDILITPRLHDLLRDQMVYLDAGRYRLTVKGRRFVRIFIFYRGLLNAAKGG